MKKLLLFAFLLIGAISNSQEVEKNAAQKSNLEITITKVKAYPNPLTVKTNFTFISSKSQAIAVTVKNLVGNTIFATKTKIRKGLNTIPFERNNLPKGMYIYSIQTDSEIVSKRLVIK